MEIVNIDRKDFKKTVIKFFEKNKKATHLMKDSFLKVPIKLYTINQMKKKKDEKIKLENLDFFKKNLL